MPTLTIRRLQGETIIDQAFPLLNYAFDKSPQENKREEWLKRLPYADARYYMGAFEGDTITATANFLYMTQQVRGKIYDMGGVAGVAVHPLYRRQGHARQLLREMMVAMRAAGQSFTTLYPFRESFYERLGYVGYPQVRMLDIPTAHLTPLLKWQVAGEIVWGNIRDLYDEWRAFQHQVQAHVHGYAIRDEASALDWRDGGRFWLAIAKVDGVTAGMMMYTVDGYSKNFKAYRFFALNSAAKYLLLQWVARHADQTTNATITTPPTVHLDLALSDLLADAKTQSIANGYSATPMGRVLDVAKIGGMQVGGGTSLNLTISDPDCAWNNGTFRFSNTDGLLEVAPTTAPADGSLTIQGLSAMIYGAHDPADFAYRGWGKVSAETAEHLRAMFPPLLPFLNEDF